jgi:hypothetical protein
MTSIPAAEEEPMDRLGALAIEVRAGFAEMRAGMAEVRLGVGEVRGETRTGLAELRAETRSGLAELRAETRAGLAELRSELAEFRTLQSERHATLIDALADLRNEYRGHTHGE